MTTLVLVGVLFLKSVFPMAFQAVLAVPAGVLAAKFFGTDYAITSDYIVQIYGRLFTVNVTSACSASFYFALIFSLLFGLFFEYKRKWLLWLPFFAIILTILVNALRLVLVIYCGVLFDGILQPEYQIKLHLGLGVFVFLPSLILVHFLFERKLAVLKKRKKRADGL